MFSRWGWSGGAAAGGVLYTGTVGGAIVVGIVVNGGMVAGAVVGSSAASILVEVGSN